MTRTGRRGVFIDTSYLVALLDPRDAHNARAVELAAVFQSQRARLSTTDAVLIELCNYFCRSPLRPEAIGAVDALRGSGDWEIGGLDRALLGAGEARYRRHADKAWSLTDCISMVFMQERRIRDVATLDRGFTQAGFHVLMP